MSRETSIKAPTAVADHKITVSTSAAQSNNTFNPGSHIFVCDQGCSIVFGSDPTATTNYPRIPANTLLRIGGVVEGHKISIIADGDGTAYLWEE